MATSCFELNSRPPSERSVCAPVGVYEDWAAGRPGVPSAGQSAHREQDAGEGSVSDQRSLRLQSDSGTFVRPDSHVSLGRLINAYAVGIELLAR